MEVKSDSIRQYPGTPLFFQACCRLSTIYYEIVDDYKGRMEADGYHAESTLWCCEPEYKQALIALEYLCKKYAGN